MSYIYKFIKSLYLYAYIISYFAINNFFLHLCIFFSCEKDKSTHLYYYDYIFWLAKAVINHQSGAG